jgi:hypothetical protein
VAKFFLILLITTLEVGAAWLFGPFQTVVLDHPHAWLFIFALNAAFVLVGLAILEGIQAPKATELAPPLRPRRRAF